MPSRRYFDAKRELIAAFDTFLDAVLSEMSAPEPTAEGTNTLRTASTLSSNGAKGAPIGTPNAVPTSGQTIPAVPQKATPRRPVVGGKPLPTPSTPAPKGEPQLTDAQRAAAKPEALRLAREVVKLLGASNPQVKAGVKGQLALNRVPHDEQLLKDVIAEASRG